MATAIKKVSYYMAAPVETCDRCSAGIKHVFAVHYRDGAREKFGSECINKILAGDTSLKGLFNRNVKKLQKYQRGLAALSMPAEQMPRGREYFGSGLYFIADETGEDVFAETHWFFHPLYDAEKNAIGPNYIVRDAREHADMAMREITGGKAWLAGEIERIETFLARVVQKGLLNQAAERSTAMRNARGTEIGPSALAQARKRRERKQRAMRIRMTYTPDGTVYHWTVRKDQGGWTFTDHEGCERFAEGNWQDLVAKFRLVAENYGMATNIS